MCRKHIFRKECYKLYYSYVAGVKPAYLGYFFFTFTHLQHHGQYWNQISTSLQFSFSGYFWYIFYSQNWYERYPFTVPRIKLTTTACTMTHFPSVRRWHQTLPWCFISLCIWFTFVLLFWSWINGSSNKSYSDVLDVPIYIVLA